jgi:hypothetical protein
MLALSPSLEPDDLNEARIEFEAMDKDGDRALTESEYIASCIKVYKRVHEQDFDLWVYAVLTSKYKCKTDLKAAKVHIGLVKKKKGKKRKSKSNKKGEKHKVKPK